MHSFLQYALSKKVHSTTSSKVLTSSSKVEFNNFWSKLIPFNFMYSKKSTFFSKYLIDIVFGLPP
jgi:hypothetical protein